MFYELRTYTVRPGQLMEFLKLFETAGLPVISRYATLVGYWFTEIGELNQVIHIWAYESLDERTKRRAALMADPDWQGGYLVRAMPLLTRQESVLMRPAPFSPIR